MLLCNVTNVMVVHILLNIRKIQDVENVVALCWSRNVGPATFRFSPHISVVHFLRVY